MDTVMIPKTRKEIIDNYDSFDGAQIFSAIFNPGIVDQQLYFDPRIGVERLVLDGQHFGEILGIRYEHVANYLNKYCTENRTIFKIKKENGYTSWWITPEGVFEFIVNSKIRACDSLKTFIVTRSSEIIKHLLFNK